MDTFCKRYSVSEQTQNKQRRRDQQNLLYDARGAVYSVYV